MATIEDELVRTEPIRRSGLVRAAIVLLTVVPVATHVAFLLVKERSEWPMLFTDDAYYYFGVARSIARGDGSTFTGLVETNGYHPLWMVALTAVAVVARTPAAFLGAIVLLQAAIWVLVAREAVAIGRRLGAESAAVVGLVLLGVLAVMTGQLSFSGMESAPLILALLVALRMMLSLGGGSDDEADLRLGIVLALVCLIRLDAAFTVGPLALTAAARGGADWRTIRRRGWRLLGPSVAALLAFAAASLVVFGTPTPVSGQAKALGSPFLNVHSVTAFFEAGLVQNRPLWFGAMVVVLLAVVCLEGSWRSTQATRRLMACIGALAVGQVIQWVYLVFGTSYPLWAWYFFNLAVLAFCVGSLAVHALTIRAPRLTTPVAAAIGITFAVAVVPVVFLTGFTHSQSGLETAEFIRDELPRDAVLAMGDRAGLVGYLGDRPLLQLEGLVADADWLSDLEDGIAPARMRAEGVDYYVWSGVPAGTPVEIDGQRCVRLQEPRAGDGPKFEVTVCDPDLVFSSGGGGGFWVWRFRPELNRDAAPD